METKKISAGSLKQGRYVVIDGAACVVRSVQSSRPGKHGHAKCRIEAVGLIDNQKRIIVKPAHDNLDSPLIEKETAQVLSVTGNQANLMDMKSYETFDLEIPDELKDKVKEETQVIYWKVLKDKIMKQVKSKD